VVAPTQEVGIALAFTPIVVGWVVLFCLLKYRRDGRVLSALSGFGVLRPDRYTDEGHGLLRVLWFLVVMTIPWCVSVLTLFGFP